MIDILLNRNVFVGFLLGLALAWAFHSWSPADADSESAGAWLIALGCLGGVIKTALEPRDRR